MLSIRSWRRTTARKRPEPPLSEACEMKKEKIEFLCKEDEVFGGSIAYTLTVY